MEFYAPDDRGLSDCCPWLQNRSYVCLNMTKRQWSIELKRGGMWLGTEFAKAPDDVDLGEMIGWLNGGRDEI